MSNVYTALAERHNLGTEGEEVRVSKLGPSLKYLQVHGYCEAKPDDVPDAEAPAPSSGALGGPRASGAVVDPFKVR